MPRKKQVSLNPRTKKLYEEQGYTCETVERWNSFAKIRQDLFGFIDILAVGPAGTVGIQTTDSSHAANRRAKILASEKARAWVTWGNTIALVSWRKQPHGKRFKYVPRIELIGLSDFNRSLADPR